MSSGYYSGGGGSEGNTRSYQTGETQRDARMYAQLTPRPRALAFCFLAAVSETHECEYVGGRTCSELLRTTTCVAICVT